MFFCLRANTRGSSGSSNFSLFRRWMISSIILRKVTWRREHVTSMFCFYWCHSLDVRIMAGRMDSRLICRNKRKFRSNDIWLRRSSWRRLSLAIIWINSESPSCFEEVIEEFDRVFDLPFPFVLPCDDAGSVRGRLRWGLHIFNRSAKDISSRDISSAMVVPSRR